MKDNEIIKALECCNHLEWCNDCPLQSEIKCKDILSDKSVDLINRQQAEIERLQKLLDGAEICIDELEYALDKVGHSNSRVDDALEKYNNFVKEMVGEEK